MPIAITSEDIKKEIEVYDYFVKWITNLFKFATNHSNIWAVKDNWTQERISEIASEIIIEYKD